VRQYTKRGVLAVWGAAALPMGVLSWVVAPAVANPHGDPARWAQTLLAVLTAGLVWQFVLVTILVAHEQRTLRPSVLREALWLRAPSDERTGRRGGRLWWWLLPFVLGVAALQVVPFRLQAPAERDMGVLLSSDAGHSLFQGNWLLFALVVVMALFNTVLGEELLFRGLLLPRMQGAFGRADWFANGVFMGLYHLHQPWSIPTSVLAGLLYAYPTRRLRSAWMGIILHSTASVVIIGVVLAVVLS
jgi:membrane protease YdiL (CAAX protease family)